MLLDTPPRKTHLAWMVVQMIGSASEQQSRFRLAQNDGHKDSRRSKWPRRDPVLGRRFELPHRRETLAQPVNGRCGAKSLWAIHCVIGQ